MERHLHDLRERRRIHDGDRVRKAVQDVETPQTLQERDPGGAPADDDSLGRGPVRPEDAGPRQARAVDLEELAGSDGREIADRPGTVPDHHPRLRDAGLALEDVRRGVTRPVDMRVQIDARHHGAGGRVDDRHEIVDHVAAHSLRQLEADEVARVGVRHVDPAVARIDRDLEQGRPEMIDGADGQARGIDDEQVVIRESEGQAPGPVLARLVPPGSGRPVPLHDQRDRRLLRGRRIGQGRIPRHAGRERRIGWRSGGALDVVQAEGGEAGGIEVAVVRGDHVGVHHRGLVSRVEDHDVDLLSVAGWRERPGEAAEDRDREGRRCEVREVEDLDRILVRDRDEGLVVGEDDIGRLDTDGKSPHGRSAVEIDDAHGPRDAVHDPGLGVGASHHRHGLQPDRDRRLRGEAAVRGDDEDLQQRVGRVHRQESPAGRRQRDGVNVRRLEVDVVGLDRRDPQQAAGQNCKGEAPSTRPPEAHGKAGNLPRCAPGRNERSPPGAGPYPTTA